VASLGESVPFRLQLVKLTIPTKLPMVLETAGCLEWTTLEKFHNVVRVFQDVFGVDRVSTSREGFNRIQIPR